MKRLARNEKGQALVLTLVLILIGSLLIAPTLSLMGTGIMSGRVYEQKNAEIYAADAGVEDALWNIRYDTVDDLIGAGYDPYNYSSAYSYPYNLLVNDKVVSVNISNVWIPKGLSAPDAATARLIIEDEKLMIIGYPGSEPSTYEIKIVYYYQYSSDINIKTVGVWLSSGFGYTEYAGSCSLYGQSFYNAPTVSLDKGGYAVVWNFNSPYPLLSSFPGPTPGKPLVRTFTFKYSGPEGQIPELVASWVDTTGVPGTTYSCSWDDTIRLYKIVSVAGGVQIDAYGAKTKFRRIKSAISGDYFGTGNSLLRGMLNPPDNIHNQLYNSASATVVTDDDDDTQGVPSDAVIEDVYLYWTGWIDWHGYEPPDSGSQTRYPSGDWYFSGTWSPVSNRYQQVDEQPDNDGDTTYLLHGTTNGWGVFSFPAFTVDVPSGEGMGIRALTVTLWARDNISGVNKMHPVIRVGGSYYQGISTEVQPSYTSISYTWTVNPQTNRAWTEDQINGIGTNALQAFGVYSWDANPQIRLTQVYAQVYWGYTLMYPDDPTEEDLQALVEDIARVNKVLFNNTEVTADDWQTLYPTIFQTSSTYYGTWYYTCKADVTDLIQGWINATTIEPNGAGTYTVGHVVADNEEDPSYKQYFEGSGYTGYPLGTPAPDSSPPARYCAAHAGWSMLILYSSAGVYNHQFYLYDIQTPGFNYFFGWNGGSQCPLEDPDWDNDGYDGGTVSGFLVPPQSPGEDLAGRITVMVGEGDKANGLSSNCYCKDRFKVNGTEIPDGTGLYDVWNGSSVDLPDSGIDIDHFYITWASGILDPMDVSATINVPTGMDGFTMSYMLLLFRSELGTGGVITNYAIRIL